MTIDLKNPSQIARQVFGALLPWVALALLILAIVDIFALCGFKIAYVPAADVNRLIYIAGIVYLIKP